MAADFKVYGFCEQKQRREVMLKADIEERFKNVEDELSMRQQDITYLNNDIQNLRNSTRLMTQNRNDILALQKQNEILTNWLEVGNTTVSIVDNRITTRSALSFYTSIYGVNPKNVVVSDGAVELTFDAQIEEMEVGVRVDG